MPASYDQRLYEFGVWPETSEVKKVPRVILKYTRISQPPPWPNCDRKGTSLPCGIQSLPPTSPRRPVWPQTAGPVSPDPSLPRRPLWPDPWGDSQLLPTGPRSVFLSVYKTFACAVNIPTARTTLLFPPGVLQNNLEEVVGAVARKRLLDLKHKWDAICFCFIKKEAVWCCINLEWI